MSRPSFEEINMRMAMLVAERSTCQRLNVGCVITSTNFRKILSMGYNGNASGLKNECDSNEPGKCGCFVSGTRILPTAVSRAYRRRYEGEVVRVITAAGDFTVTPHHPILASKRGWTPAEFLRKGDDLLGTLGGESALTGTPNDEHAVPIEDVFEALLVSGCTVRRSGTRHEFHGDGCAYEDVDVVAAHSGLSTYAQARGNELVSEPSLAAPFVVAPSLGSLSFVDELVGSVEHESCFDQTRAYDDDTDTVLARQCRSGLSRAVSSHDLSHWKVDHCRPFVPAEILGAAAKYASISESPLNGGVRDAEIFSDGEHGLSALVTAHKIIDVERYRWSGHVYNLETVENWYSVQPGGIVAHNCIHAEQNAVINCDSLRSTPKIIFTTNLPCPVCAKFMINLGNVEMVYYREDYRIRRGLDLLGEAGIPFEQLKIA